MESCMNILKLVDEIYFCYFARRATIEGDEFKGYFDDATLSTNALVNDNESRPETCANCDKISTLQLAGNPYGTSSVTDFWRICAECFVEQETK